MKSIKRPLAILTPIIFFTFLGCKSDLTSKTATSTSGSNEAITDTEKPSSPIDTKPILTKGVNFVVGVGVGGFKVATNSENLATEFEYNIPKSLYNASPPNCGNIGAVVIYVNTSERCCFSNPQECFGSGGHTDYLWRAVTSGNGMFVAVGGWNHGIVISTRDGKSWSEKINLHHSNNLVKGTSQNGATWLSGIAYGLNKFVAVSGLGYLYYSSDALTWHNDSDSGSSGRAFRNIVSLGDKGFLATGDAGVWAHTDDGKTWSVADQANTDPDSRVGRLNLPAAGSDYVLSHLSSQNGETRVFRLDINNLTAGWSEVTKINSTVHRILYVPEQNKFYSFGSKTVYTSVDGMEWSSEATNIFAPRQVFYNNGLFASYLINGLGEVSLQTSSDGKTWETNLVSPEEGQGLRAMTMGTL